MYGHTKKTDNPNNFEIQEKARGLILYFLNTHRTIVIKIVWCWCKNKNID